MDGFGSDFNFQLRKVQNNCKELSNVSIKR